MSHVVEVVGAQARMGATARLACYQDGWYGMKCRCIGVTNRMVSVHCCRVGQSERGLREAELCLSSSLDPNTAFDPSTILVSWHLLYVRPWPRPTLILTTINDRCLRCLNRHPLAGVRVPENV